MERIQENKTKLIDILKDFSLDQSFPENLVDLLTYSGYYSLHSISLIKDDDILKLEDFARNVLPDLLSQEEKNSFYGIFIRNISKFSVVEGEKKLLKVLINKCQAFLNKPSAARLENKNTKPRTRSGPKAKRRKNNEPDQELDSSSDCENGDDSPGQNERHILEHIKLVVNTYQSKTLSYLDENRKNALLKNRLRENVEVKFVNDTVYITCNLCDFQSKAYSEVDRQRNNKKKWVFSNFNRHFKTHVKDQSSLAVQPVSSKSTSKITSFFTVLRKDEGNTEIPSTIEIDLTNTPENLEERHPQNRESEQELIADKPRSSILSSSVTPISRSRAEKENKSRLLTFDACQTKITDFYEICEQIKIQITENSLLRKELTTSANILCQYNEVQFESSASTSQASSQPSSESLSFFELLKATVIKNSSRTLTTNRFSDELKKLCLYLFLTSGRLAYQTLVTNIPKGLPSITTLSRTLSENYEKLTEGQVAFDALKQYLEKKKYPLRIFISEDQTAIVKRPRYDQTTNQLVGYVLLTSEQTGFPDINQNEVNSIFDIKRITENKELACNAYVYMAQPIVDGAAAFCLSIFGSNNAFNTEEVLLRWKHIENEARNFGITVEGFSADGDSRCLKAMKTLANLPCDTQRSLYSPYFQASFLTNSPVAVQDTVHIGTKLKTRLLNTNVRLKMGNYEVSKDHLMALIQNVSKDKHLLCHSFLDSTDKMNFDAIDKLSSTRVTDILSQNEESKGTSQFLILTRYILDSFLDKAIAVNRRVYLLWYSIFFLRLWRAWIKESTVNTLTKNWITLNSYTCVELNAHALLILIERFRDKPDYLMPWIFSSQPCEKFFRQTRSMTSTCSTVVNFDLLDLLRRRHRIQAINSIVSDSGDSFIFPRERNKRLGTNVKSYANIPTQGDLLGVLLTAKKEAIKDAEALGIHLSKEECEAALNKVSIPVINWLPEEGLESGNNNTTQNEPVVDLVVDVNEEDQEDIESEQIHFENLDELNLKDFTGKKTITDRSVLQLQLKNKEITVKKSTLCWLYFNKRSRLSTDRLKRCKGMSNSRKLKKNKGSCLKDLDNDTLKQKLKHSRKNFGKNRSVNRSRETSDSESDQYSAYSELEDESSLEESTTNIDDDLISGNNDIDLQKEGYYAVCYKSWYIGRITEVVNETTSEVKFLKLELDKYVWPREEDKQVVDNKFIFYGPIFLEGNGPFQIRRADKVNIEKAFKNVKKNLKDFL